MFHTSERESIKAPEREVKELHRANEILEPDARIFRPDGSRPASDILKAFIDQHCETFGIESTCKVLRVVRSRRWRHAAQLRNPSRPAEQ